MQAQKRCGFMPYPKEALGAGQRIGERYRIGALIGRGGFGFIYRAREEGTGRIVAVKEFCPHEFAVRREDGRTVFPKNGKDRIFAELRSDFLKEARYMAMVSAGEGFAEIYHCFEENDTAYLVMEFIEGILLKDWFFYGHRTEYEERRRIMRNLLDCLEILHEKGIVHRDVSPDNIFLTVKGKIRLIDFGAAGKADDAGCPEKKIIVKTGFAPPEQYQKGIKPDIRMDLYAAGAVNYYLLTGSRPDSSLVRLRNRKNGKPCGLFPKDPGKKYGRIRKEELEWTEQAMALDAAERFSSAAKMKEMLDPAGRKEES